MRAMALPASLEDRMELFEATGQVETYDHGLFLEPSWIAVYLGQRRLPQSHDPRVDQFPADETARRLAGLKGHIAATADRLPSHADWIAHNCPAPGYRVTA